MPESGSHKAFIDWFRGTSPYVNTHRGRTFVVALDGETAQGDDFAALIHDIALLNALGIRLVLVHGCRPQVDARLAERGIPTSFQDGLRVTTPEQMVAVTEAAGQVRTEIEALLSMGLANSPMAGLRVRVVSGNVVTARPLGVRDSVDFRHTGQVRRIDHEAVRAHLADGAIALLSPLGFSPTGEVFNLSAMEVAREVAGAIRADKLLCLVNGPGLLDADGTLLHEASPRTARERATQMGDPALLHTVTACLAALDDGVPRAHLVDRRVDGALLQELFTRDGAGTLIAADPFEATRPAHIDDVGGVLELITPLEEAGVLVRRSRERLETEIGDFILMERDGMVIGCAACHTYPEERVAELACLAVLPAYRKSGRGDRLLHHVARTMVADGIRRLFVLTTQTAHWFLERGFVPGRLEDLPVERQAMHNYQRNAKVFIKEL